MNSGKCIMGFTLVLMLVLTAEIGVAHQGSNLPQAHGSRRLL